MASHAQQVIDHGTFTRNQCAETVTTASGWPACACSTAADA